jgi:hypothetical protein
MHFSPNDGNGSGTTRQKNWREIAGFSELYEYWSSIRVDGKLPQADKFDLLALTLWLPDMTLFDIVGPENYFCRFAGTAVVERLGYDMSQKNLFQFQSDATREQTRDSYFAIVNQPCGAVARYANHYSSGRAGVVRTIYLPLAAPPNGHPRIVCMSQREEDAEYASPIEKTITATDIYAVEWLDIGFGLPNL